ncbi:energy transducer TonB [uncultured Psychroserpens sp.]|uniref:energy transducer TonB n=1 Tax=uncultured Psychroserpens sp. TaxID=255436 RepID=UPI002625D4BC|nr:energy transducer TonB [uncultured Psychroserpens sp.]
METYNQYIELINQYLSNLLSDESRIAFESKLENDPEFKTIYEEHMVFINGLQRVQVKADIQKGQRSYYTEKWVKISGFSILVLGLLVMIYTLVFKTSEIEPTPNNESINVVNIDSVSTQKDNNDVSVAISEEKPDSTKTTSQHVVSYTTTTIQEKFGGISETNIDIKKKAQMVKINVQNDTTITCKEGTVLNISKGSFINPNTGKTVTGVIDLNVTEYYKLSDILMANLSTVSNGKQLETGGMIYIEASQGTTTLELKDNRSLEILFPTPQKKSGMQLFNGEWQENNINWSLTNTTDLEVIDIDEAHIDVPFNVVEVVPTFPGCESEDNDIRKQCTTAAISKFISRKFNTDVALGLGLSGRQRILSMFKIDEDGNITFIQSRAAHPRLSEEADRVISLLPKMSPGLQRGKPVTVPYSLPINFTVVEDEELTQKYISLIEVDSVSTSTSLVQANDIIVRPTEMDTVYTTRRGMVELIREVMHDKDFLVDSLFIQKWQTYEKQKLIRKLGRLDNERYILRKPLFEMDDTRFKILEDDSITRGGHVIRFPWNETQVPTTTQIMTIVPKQQFSAGGEIVSVEEFETRLGDEADTSISTSDATYYALSTTKLGWINCDRFINGRTKRIKYKLKIKNTDGASVNMVFKSYNSILPSWYINGAYDFKTVGLDEEVILVAIKRTNGKLYYDTIETKTEVNPQLDFEFKEVSIEELKEELEKLNSIFN